MVTTRAQSEAGSPVKTRKNSLTKGKANSSPKKYPVKRKAGQKHSEEPPKKKTKEKSLAESDEAEDQQLREEGTIERGHIYFFYRPKVQLEEAHSLDQVKNFHMLLIPQPPEFATSVSTTTDAAAANAKREEDSSAEMAVLKPGADAVPSVESSNTTKKRFRLVTVGKKKLPDPKLGGGGKGRKETFWATVTKVGDDLDHLEKGLGEKSYDTKTRGTRHEAPARLVGRGGYAIVNNSPRVPSGRETHLGYCLSHPTELGDVQTSLGIQLASSFVLQVKNPLAPASLPGQANSQGAQYPDRILDIVFGRGQKGREKFGLKFATCETAELLDYEGAQLLFIAAREGEEGLESSLGEGRGKALAEHENEEAKNSVDKVFKELALDVEAFPEDAIRGEWI